MITCHENQNIFFSEADVLVCPVNTRGVMGNGLALAFRNRYGGLYDAYRKASFAGVFEKEGFFIFTAKHGKKILCFPTKRHWIKDSHIKWIEEGLQKIVDSYKDLGIKSIAIPAIGCGYGNLEWPDVKAKILEIMADVDMEVHVLEPQKRA